VRGFQRAGFGPRDACEDPVTHQQVGHCTRDALGGELFWATTAELRFPFPFIPDSLGMQGAFFVDAGSLFDPSQIALQAVEAGNLDDCSKKAKNCVRPSFINDSSAPRVSAGFSVIWQSPLGPLRADIAEALLKAEFDRTELFRFGASTNF